MSIIKTSLHESYQSSFGLLWCLREIGANGIDGEERNKQSGKGAFEWSYSKRSGTVEFLNWGIRVPTSALLIGTSESRSDDACIGKFGEGLPLSLKQLCYLGHDVEIFNRDEKWTPKLEAQKEFDGARCLVIKTRAIKDRHAFIVRVKGVPEAEWNKLQTLFLRAHPNFDEEQTASGYYSEQKVLLQPEFKGKIYHKGVLLLERDDLLFGYSLCGNDTDKAIGRDRQLIDDYDLRALTVSVLNDAVREDCDFQNVLVSSLFCGEDELELQDIYSSLGYRRIFREKCVERFVAWYGEEAVPVSSEEERKQAEQVGLHGIVVSRTLCSILTHDIQGLSERLEVLNNSIKEEIPLNQLGERAHGISKVVHLMSFAVPQWENFGIKVVEFGGVSLPGRFSPDDDQELHLAKHIAESDDETLLKAVINLVAGQFDEVSASDLLCRLVTNFTEGY